MVLTNSQKSRILLSLTAYFVAASIRGTVGDHWIENDKTIRPEEEISAMIDAENSDSTVTAQLGTTGFLRCSVSNIGDQEVSWVRRRDYHILTSGRQVFTPDSRIAIKHMEQKDDWVLMINFLQKRDEGQYICQVPTDRGLLKHEVTLSVTEPEAFILGGKDFHVDHGSTISLVCIVEKSLLPPEYVFWYHNDRLLNFGSPRGGITVETESGTRTHSQLRVRSAVESDSGNYTCKAAKSQPASITVHISGGDTAAAISGKSAASYPSVKYHPLILAMLCTLVRVAGAYQSVRVLR